MSSWRVGVPEQVQRDLDALMSFAVDRAAGLLKQRGQLVPFAARVPAEGAAPSPVVANPPDLPQPVGARDLLLTLYSAARSEAPHTRAVAFTADISLEDGRAIRVEAEHREGTALTLRVPYRRTFLGGVKLGTMRLSTGPFRIWR